MTKPLDLALIGIGSGDPDHLTLQAIKAINRADLILIPLKGDEKSALAALRQGMLDQHLTRPDTIIQTFDMPRRAATGDYLRAVDDWHDAIAVCWQQAIARHPGVADVALLVWGDPSLYDSTLRIAARLDPAPRLTVVPGITSMQALTAGHAIPLNGLGAPVVITTGRRLRDHGWPEGADRVVVMLDGDLAMAGLPEADRLHVWWGGCVGMAEQVLIAGPLPQVIDDIRAARAALRDRLGWVMDIYLLERRAP
ncbi:precorrin-6A synthase (deacetylating) [Paracoccus sp. p4-l81]|uniref:precorrin-6A synthase (deacetylating) n=1 Tax=unclassified Paracoccus (in: a-proteobacteria) TaxID=2688777 RepID=UPI0035B991EE